MAERMYSLAEIKTAFWEQFHKAGEVWFDYLGTEAENTEATESAWTSFKESLDPSLRPQE